MNDQEAVTNIGAASCFIQQVSNIINRDTDPWVCYIYFQKYDKSINRRYQAGHKPCNRIRAFLHSRMVFSVPIPKIRRLSGVGSINAVILPNDEQTYYGGEIIVGGLSVSLDNDMNMDPLNAGWAKTRTRYKLNIYDLADSAMNSIMEWCER